MEHGCKYWGLYCKRPSDDSVFSLPRWAIWEAESCSLELHTVQHCEVAWHETYRL